MKRRTLNNLICILLATGVLFCFNCNTCAQEIKPEEKPAAPSNQEMDLRNIEIASIVDILSRLTGRNYIIDERVKGKASVVGRVTEDNADKVLESVLAFKGFTLVPLGGNFWKIVPSKEARQSTIPTKLEGSSGPPSATVITRVVSLKYVSSDEMKQLLSQLISPDGLITAYTGTNSLIIIDNEDNIERLVQLVSVLDIPAKDREMVIIPVVFADATDIAQKLNDLLGEGGSAKGGGKDSASDLLGSRMRDSMAGAGGINRQINPAVTNASTNASYSTVMASARQPKILADERTNSVIVVADEDTLARIRALVSQLDSKVDLSGNRFYVYHCQHASAEDLAEILGALGGGSTGSTKKSGGTDNDLRASGYAENPITGRTRNNSRTGGAANRLANSSRRPGESLRSSDGAGVTSANIGENISISADPATNTLIIVASKTDYQKILELLRALDVKRRQVLVEATLLEVGVENSVSLGTDFITSTGGADGAVLAQSNFGNKTLTDILANPANISEFSIAAASSGTISIGGDFTIPSQAVLVSAAQNSNNVNVLSAPTILATDNEQAEIIVGQNVPFLASTSTSETNLNNTFNQIDRQDVGITLRITPQISSGETVTLDLFTEVSNVVAATANSSLGPTTTVRTSQTTVIAKDGQMIVTGGLMADDLSESEEGVPFFKDIPVIGHMFRDSTEDRRRRNLLIFITPRVLKDQFDARDVTKANTNDMQGMIAKDEIYPSREEILENMDIDRVAEPNEYNGPKPSTITAPKKADAHASILEEDLSNLGSTTQSKEQQQGDIELKVAPEFVPPLVPSDQAKASLIMGKTKLSGQSFLVLQLEEQNSKSARNKVDTQELPFANSSQQQVFGVIIPEEATVAAKTFFKIGGLYSYSLGSTEVSLRVVGIFSDATEATTIHSELPRQWYTLSPFELINIGNGPWKSNFHG